MTTERCLYTLIHAPEERHDELVRELVAPVVREIRGSPELDSLFFARYNKPDWQLRFRVLGRPEWIDGPVRQRIERGLGLLSERGLVEACEFAEYEREYERYGGVEGMRLSEQIFLHDTLACLDLIQADARGLLAKTRREFSLVLTERFLDLLHFGRPQRIAFYRFAYSWAIELKAWEPDDLKLLEERYHSLKAGLADLLGVQWSAPETQWGGAEPARIAAACLSAMGPLVDELLVAHAAGRIQQDLVHLAWSLTHMHCNRLGVDANAEAILRFFMHRLHEDGALETA